MRPVIRLRPDGTYYKNSMITPVGMGLNNKTRCLALCVELEVNRLYAMMMEAGDLITQKTYRTLAAAVAAKSIPITIPNLPTVAPAGNAGGGAVVAGPVSGLDEGFVGGAVAYDNAIEDLPVAYQRAMDNLIHYLIIKYNLQYDLGIPDFPWDVTPTLIVADIPYAVSAMQDARERARAVPGSRIMIRKNPFPLVVISDRPISRSPRSPRSSFLVKEINKHIEQFYKTWEQCANRGSIPYSAAATELVDVLGPYCTYCEANLKTQIDVEHILPKGKGANKGGILQGFPSHAKSWLNFLPACPRCNSTKNAHPTKLDITNFAAAAGAGFVKDDNTPLNAIALSGRGGDARITDKEYARLYPDYYQFPLEADSYQNVGFVLWNRTNDNPDHTSIATQLTWTIQAVNEIDKSVTILDHLNGRINVQVFIDDGSFGGGHPLASDPAAVVKVSNMKNICGLNATNANTDRRVLERTEAWFMALEAVNKIQTDLDGLAVPANGAADIGAIYNEVYFLWRDATIRTIKEKGFLSVWLKIFNEFPHPLAETPGAVPAFAAVGPYVNGGAAEAAMTLAQDIAQTILESRYFPNTNWTQVP